MSEPNRTQITERVDDSFRGHKLRITATLILDEFAWTRNDITAQEWMLNEIILGDDLRVFSPEIGDEVGILLVHSAKDEENV